MEINHFYSIDFNRILEYIVENPRICFDKNFTIKFYAQKEGWESSQIDSVEFFQTIPEPAEYQLTYAANQRYLGIGKELLFDLEKGSSNFGDNAWMAFREHPFELTCELGQAEELNQVTLIFIQVKLNVFDDFGLQVIE